MNIFQLNYEVRLQEWHDLRETLKDKDIRTQVIETDKFWQRCPISNHYLHPTDIESWPGPWELLYDNNYCVYARALGMIYTLLLLGITDIDLVDAIDNNSEEVTLVLVDSAKYILNYWPDTVVNSVLQDFRVTKSYNIAPITTKIGKP